MHITSGLSPVSGEFLDSSSHLYGDGVSECGATYFAIDNGVPESSHTVEIEYVLEEPEIFTQIDISTKVNGQDTETSYQDQEKSWVKDVQIKDVRSTVKYPEQVTEDTEMDLTNLTWLQNITNIMPVPQFALEPMSPKPKLPPPPQMTRLQRFNRNINRCRADYLENREMYQNEEQKPPYSYCMMICMAMRCNNDKLTLSAIYSWIRDNFKYYRTADPTWQNSIRHNLSLNKVFVKVARSKQERGKGGFWKLDLSYLEGNKRISNRPQNKKKKTQEPNTTEESVAVANIPEIVPYRHNQPIEIHLPEPPYMALSNMPLTGTRVIVEPVEGNLSQNLSHFNQGQFTHGVQSQPEEDLNNLLLCQEWPELQLDMLDNYLEPW